MNEKKLLKMSKSQAYFGHNSNIDNEKNLKISVQDEISMMPAKTVWAAIPLGSPIAKEIYDASAFRSR